MRPREMLKHADKEGKRILARHKGEDVDALILNSGTEMLCARVGGFNRVTDFIHSEVGGTSIFAALGKRVAEVSLNDLQKGTDLAAAVSRALVVAHNSPEIPWFQGFPRIDPQEMERPYTLLSERKMADIIDDALDRFAKEGYCLSGALFSLRHLDSVSKFGQAKGTSWRGSQLIFDMAATDRNNTIETKMTNVSATLGGLTLEMMYDEAIEELQLQEKLPLRDLASGAYDVVLYSPALSHLLEFTSAYGLDGGATEDNNTFTANTKIGDRIFSKLITITDEPYHPENPSPAPIDIFGCKKPAIDVFVRDGILEKRWYDFWSAQRHKKTPTGHSPSIGFGPSHLVMKPGDGPDNETEALKRLGNGIYIRDFHYTRVDDAARGLFTGMTRYGTYLVENGVATARLPNLRFLDSIPRMLQNVEWLSSGYAHASSSEFYGIRPAPVHMLPLFSQINGFQVTGATPLKQLR